MESSSRFLFFGKEKKLYAVVCPGVVKTAAEIVEEMI